MKDNGCFCREVRILVVDDSAFMRAALTRIIGSESEFEVVGTASSGADALKKISSLDPDVVTLDVQMPGLDGLATLRCIMHDCPRPVIMVSAATEKDAEITFDSLSAGAFDYVPKQMAPNSLEIAHIRSDLIAKIRAAARTRGLGTGKVENRKPPQSHQWSAHCHSVAPAIVAIGTSTGGPKALEEILPLFPQNFPLPIVIVQHMPAGFTATFAQRLNNLSAITVREATQSDLIRPGTAYICPAGIHMQVQRRVSDSRIMISLDAHPADAPHIPSVDVLMKSVARVYRDRALGVIMTGMGCDGAEGMAAIHSAGGLTIGQDEMTCSVYGMPRACAELGVLNRVVPLSEIPSQILHAVRQRKPA